MLLLGTQTLYDLVCAEPNVLAWVRAQPPEWIGISVASLGKVEAEVEATAVSDGRAEHDSALRRHVAIAKRLKRLEDFDEAAALRWAGLLNMNLTADLGGTSDPDDIDRMVIATALSRSLTLVDRPQAYHGQITGLNVVDPY